MSNESNQSLTILLPTPHLCSSFVKASDLIDLEQKLVEIEQQQQQQQEEELEGLVEVVRGVVGSAGAKVVHHHTEAPLLPGVSCVPRRKKIKEVVLRQGVLCVEVEVLLLRVSTCFVLICEPDRTMINTRDTIFLSCFHVPCVVIYFQKKIHISLANPADTCFSSHSNP